MENYFKARKIIADYLYFYCKGYKYSGQGIIFWEPNKGFSLEALLEKTQSYPDLLELGRVSVPKQSDYTSIRVWTTNFEWVLIPDIHIDSLQFDLLSGNISINFFRIYICENPVFVSNSSDWIGNSLYRIKTNNRFSDPVSIQTLIKGEPIHHRGLFYENGNTKLIGYFIDDEHFYLSWKLSSSLPRSF